MPATQPETAVEMTAPAMLTSQPTRHQGMGTSPMRDAVMPLASLGERVA